MSVESDSDEDLLNELEVWARKSCDRDEGGKVTIPGVTLAAPSSKQNTTNIVTKPQSYSLHITKLPPNADKSSILSFFSRQGCSVQSVRLVYDQMSSKSWNDRVFKGVAFIDLTNEKSYKKALSLHRAWFTTDDSTGKAKSSNRTRINIRPTITKNELAAIVQQTKDRVEQLKKDSLNQKKDAEKSSREDAIIKKKPGLEKPISSKPSAGMKRKHGDTSGSVVKKPRRIGKEMEGIHSKKSKSDSQNSGAKSMHRHTFHHRKGSDRRDSDRKLSKKERAKRAAIIRST